MPADDVLDLRLRAGLAEAAEMVDPDIATLLPQATARGRRQRAFRASGVVAAVLFLLITVPMTRFTDVLIARDRRRRQAAGVLA